MRDIPRNDVYKPNNVDTGTDLNNNDICKNPNFVKTSEDSGGLYKEELIQNRLLMKTLPLERNRVYTQMSSGYIEENQKFWEQ